MKYFFNFTKKPCVKITFILTLLITIYIFISAYNYVEAVSYDISNSVFRLHVIANSDSEEDQNLKYLVRDALLEYMNNIASNAASKEEVIEIASNHISEFEEIAKKVINENGFDYPVQIEIGNFSFPTKEYGDISLPSGYYDSMRVKIGEADGQNWWCVMFPPLCFIDITSGVVEDSSKETLQDNLSNEEYALISDSDDMGIKFKFKIVEFFKNVKILTASK